MYLFHNDYTSYTFIVKYLIFKEPHSFTGVLNSLSSVADIVIVLCIEIYSFSMPLSILNLISKNYYPEAVVFSAASNLTNPFLIAKSIRSAVVLI